MKTVRVGNKSIGDGSPCWISIEPSAAYSDFDGAKVPLNGGPQHTQDHTEAFKSLLSYVDVVLLESKKQIMPAYQKAFTRKDSKPTLLIEYGEYYNQ